MPIDTRLSQIQTNKLIASGTTGTATGAKLLVYPHEASDALIPNQGFIDQTVFNTGSVGTDIFLYVSGGIGQKDVGGSQAIAVFGGDVHISGNLSIDGTGAGNDNYFWSPSDPFIEASGSLAITGSFSALSLSASNGATITGSLAQGLAVDASGLNAHAQGESTGATAPYSHAEGYGTFIDTGADYAHVEGYQTEAYGIASHAEGISTAAFGDYSHAEGEEAGAFGTGSHAEGLSTTAIGNYAHAEGSGSVAFGVASHAEGWQTGTYGTGSHAEGNQVGAIGNYSHAEGELVAAGAIGFLAYINDTSQEPAFGIFTLDNQYGDISTAFDTVASVSPYQSIITDAQVNQDLRRYGYVTSSFDGTFTHVTASDSYGMGAYAIFNCLAIEGVLEGNETDQGLFGYASHAEGLGDPFGGSGGGGQAVGAYSHTEGTQNYAFGLGSHAEGNFTRAYGRNSHTEGSGSVAYGISSHAEGTGSVAFGYASHAEGDTCGALGYASHAEGAGTGAFGSGSHAEGHVTVAAGDYSHAEGFGTEAVGNYSHTEGYGTIASGSYQHVQGTFNLRNNDFSLFVIGDGVGPSDPQRGDIVRVNSGSTIGTGRVEVTGTLAATIGLSGSLTKLVDGTDYLIAGTNITLSTGSNGAITIDSAGGGGTSFYRLEVLDYASINASTSTVVGQVIFPANQFTGSLVLNGVIGNSDPTATGSLQLYNITSGSYVEIGGPGITHLSVSGANPAIITSVDLISASNFNSSSQAVYELQVSSSNPSSFAMFGGFELRPSGSFTGVTITTSSFFYTSGTWEDNNNRLATTSSVTMAGNLGSGYFADSVGSDVFFFVSGSSGSKDSATPGVAVFGGDVVISGVLHGGSPLKIGSDVNIFGNLNISQGLSGSLTKLVDGSDYLIAGNNITLSTGSTGAITISATGGGGGGGDNQRITIATGLTTISTGSVMAGQFYWNTGDWSNSPSTVTIRAIGNTTTTPHTASMRIYNLTANSFINLVSSGQTSTQFLNITGSNSTFVTSSNIISNLTNNNLYELRISSSLSSSAVILGNAELYVTF